MTSIKQFHFKKPEFSETMEIYGNSFLAQCLLNGCFMISKDIVNIRGKILN